MSRRVVVTGVGLLCSVGSSTEECWQALRQGQNGIDRITQCAPTDDAATPSNLRRVLREGTIQVAIGARASLSLSFA